MMAAILSLTLLGAALGIILGVANRALHVEADPVVDEVLALMPGSNCGQCGFPGCSGAATAIVEGAAAPTCCPPGGRALASALAEKLGLCLDLSAMADEGPMIAMVEEDLCIGCCRCTKVCPTDAIMGAAKHIHNVFREACTGCSNCIEKCPTEALVMRPVPMTLQHWVMPKPKTV